MKKKKISTAVVGGGFTGLAAAYTLAKAGHKVTIYEKDNQLGGLAGSFKAKKFILEKFYHMWYGTDNEIFNFIKDLRLSNKLKQITSRVGIFFDNSIYNFSKPIDIIKFKPLSFSSRIRFIFFILKCWFITNPKKLERINCERWIKNSANDEIYNIIWKPLLIGKFGKYHKDVSAIWLWNKLVIRGKSRNFKNSSEHLFYYKGGFSSLVYDVRKILLRKKTIIKLNEKILDIKNIGNKVYLSSNKSKNLYDNVLLTNHTPEIIQLFKKTNSKYCKRLKKIKYLSNICVILVSKKSLTDFYWLNINDTNFPFVGIIEHTNFVDKKNYNNKNLIYLSKYLSRSEKIYKKNDKELFSFTIKAIKKKFPKFDIDNILDYYIWRADYAQPITSLDYTKIIPKFTTPIKNVFVSTMSQVFPEDRGTNQAVKHGINSAKRILQNN
tara:strand:+ start:539 stop:1852 length:1314 start_codon:yes stop_codon:yes gene_type:complete